MINKMLTRILFSGVCISSLMLSSCQLLPFIGARVVDKAIDKTIDCAFGECKNNLPRTKSKPEDTIAEYYNLINKREYANAWAFLTPAFQRLKPDNNYNNYVEWWNSVDSVIVDVDSMRLISNNNSEAIVNVQLKYIMKNGRRIDDPSRFTLVPNANKQWLIDGKIKL